MNIQELKKRERVRSVELLGCGCLTREHIKVIEHQFIIWYETKYTRKQFWFLSVPSQTLKNDMTSLVHIVVPCGRYQLISLSQFYLFPTFSYFFCVCEGRVY